MSGESLRDRLATLSRGELVGLLAVIALVLAGGGLWYVRSLPRPVDVSVAAGPVAGPTVSPGASLLVVHVAGWVRQPGVYELSEGARVIDALRAAGGPRRGVGLEQLNLAEPLADGQQVLIPGRPGPAERGIEAGATEAGATEGSSGLIDVNTASATELEELPGIGEVLSQAIVDYRAENGPFTSVDQLEDVSGIGPATLADIRPLVTV